MNNLAILYNDGLQNYPRALELFEKNLKEKVKLLDKLHPDSLITTECIAFNYLMGSENYEKAIEFFDRARKGAHEGEGMCVSSRLHCSQMQYDGH